MYSHWEGRDDLGRGMLRKTYLFLVGAREHPWVGPHWAGKFYPFLNRPQSADLEPTHKWVPVGAHGLGPVLTGLIELVKFYVSIQCLTIERVVKPVLE